MEQIKIDIVKQSLKNNKEFAPLEVIEQFEKENTELEHTIKSLQLKLNTNGCDSVTDYMRYLKERNKVKNLKKEILQLNETILVLKNQLKYSADEINRLEDKLNEI